MFDTDVLPSPQAIAAAPVGELVELMGDVQRAERAAAARVLLAVGRMFLRREAEEEFDARASWRVDGWEGVAAEVSAALGISRHRAAAHIRTAVTLIEDLPKVAAVYADGLVDTWVISRIVSRVFLITDPAAMAAVDEALAARVDRWNKLSARKVTDLIDSWVITYDAVARRQSRTRDENRHFGVGPDAEGVAEIWGSLRATDAAALDARLTALAATVCPADPRTMEQRRADAAGALAAGQSRLLCECDQEECPANTEPIEPGPVVVHVLADAATIDGTGEIPGYIRGYGNLPPEMLRQVLRTATLKPLAHPGISAPESGYRPSAALAEFIRCRDLTCRFPNCDQPAEVCDIDHTVPHPVGPTHPSNCKLLCRTHHLIKTFHTGWADRQLADGTVIWTSPSGHTYTTTPFGAQLFPQLASPTGELGLPDYRPDTTPGRGMKMPTREHTRDEDRQNRIAAERAFNAELLNRLAAEKKRRLDEDPPPL